MCDEVQLLSGYVSYLVLSILLQYIVCGLMIMNLIRSLVLLENFEHSQTLIGLISLSKI